MESFSEKKPNGEMVASARMDGIKTCMVDPDPSAGQAAFGEAQTFEYTGSLAQRIFAVMINLLVLGELTLAMYFAAQKPESFTPVFLKIFFGLLVPTLIGAVFIKRFINARAIK